MSRSPGSCAGNRRCWRQWPLQDKRSRSFDVGWQHECQRVKASVVEYMCARGYLHTDNGGGMGLVRYGGG